MLSLDEKETGDKYLTENDGEIDIKDNKYCKNYLEHNFKIPANTTTSSKDEELNEASEINYENAEKQCLILYRKNVIQFNKKLYFIFEKKNKKNSKYYLNECISQIVINTNNNYYSIIDTRDLYYDRQYIIFKKFPISGDRTKKQWQRPDIVYNDSYDTNGNPENLLKDIKVFRNPIN